jgi:hypothetical protein
VVFEMIARDRADALAAALADPAVTAEDVRHAIAWDESGWPDFTLYAPVFESALRARLVLAAGDLARTEIEALRNGGIAGLEPPRIEALGLDTPLPVPVNAILEASIREAHCDLLPEAAIPALVAFQRGPSVEGGPRLFPGLRCGPLYCLTRSRAAISAAFTRSVVR